MSKLRSKVKSWFELVHQSVRISRNKFWWIGFISYNYSIKLKELYNSRRNVIFIGDVIVIIRDN